MTAPLQPLALPPENHDDFARLVLQLAGSEEPPVALTAEEHNAIDLSKEAAVRGGFAADEEVRAIWASMAGEVRYSGPALWGRATSPLQAQALCVDKSPALTNS